VPRRREKQVKHLKSIKKIRPVLPVDFFSLIDIMNGFFFESKTQFRLFLMTAPANNNSPHAALSDAEQALRAWNIDYTKRNDGTLFVAGDINLWNKGLTQLPDLSRVVVQGSFICDNNELTSLQGAPASVGGNFSCNYNHLTSLQGAPSTVGGYFSCAHNQLTTLFGGPAVVGGGFWCTYNKLVSLQGAPTSVGGDFECYENQLTDLRGAPSTVGGDFIAYDNKLISLQGAPRAVGGSFWCERNQLAGLKGGPLSVGKEFRCHENPLTSLEDAPARFRVLYSDWGVYTSWEQVPDALKPARPKDGEPDAETDKTAQDIGVLRPAASIRRRTPKGP